jgi:hypothetical protein
MKILTKTTVASLVAASVLLTSFSATADVESQETKNSQAEQAVKNSTDNKTPAKSSAEQQATENVKTPVKATEEGEVSTDKTEQKSSNKTVDENGDVSICIGDCDGESHQSHSCDDEDESCEEVYRFFKNRRDGFYVDVSAVSSVGDDYAFSNQDDTESEFDVAISYRVQLLGLFMESPGISTRRIQGMYSMPAWGLNFYNSEDYSFDLFYQYSTRGIEGLEGIQTRNEDERAGLRMTGFYDNSQLQLIYSPVSRNGEGSDGIEASISYSYNLQFRNTNFYTNLGMQYRSKEVTPYGQTTIIDDNLSTSAGISYSAEVGVEYPLTTDWVIGSYVGYNALSDRSIAARQDTVEDGYRAGLLLTFVF